MFKNTLITVISLMLFIPISFAQDPTKPIGYQSQAKPKVKKNTGKLILNAVIASRGEKMAIINDQILQVGDRVQGYRLVAIGSHQATLRSKTKEITLSMVQEQIVRKKKGAKND